MAIKIWTKTEQMKTNKMKILLATLIRQGGIQGEDTSRAGALMCQCVHSELYSRKLLDQSAQDYDTECERF